MHILILAPYPFDEAPSQRYRIEQYLKYLDAAGIKYTYSSFLDKKGWSIFFSKGKLLPKLFAICRGFLRRWLLMFRIFRYEYIYVCREAAPMGPPVFEWLIARVFRKKIIYDFDDSIWIPVASEYNKIGRFVKFFSKVSSICKMSYKVSVGNEFLAEYAEKYNKHVQIIPTVVNTNEVHNKLQNHKTNKIVVGWTGTFSTLKYLDLVVPVLQRLVLKYDFEFIVIANKSPNLPLTNSRFISWSKENEVNDLLTIHIGLMPLYDDIISKGKCGFKAIQYMSLGIPALVSPVGVNVKIVDDGINGFLCKEETDWEQRIEQLLLDEKLRTKMGAAARKKIIDEYSAEATWPLFKSLFE